MNDRVPDYYRIELLADRGEVTAMDVIDALGLNFNLGCVMKYLVRAGRKPGNKRIQDLRKALDCLEHAVEVEEYRSEVAARRSSLRPLV